jgi:hypothetical protein
MPSLEDFRAKLKSDPETALKTYLIEVSQTLDGTPGPDDVLVPKPFGEQDVVFEFVAENTIRMRARLLTDAEFKTVWYLPWVSRGAATARLDGTGSPYFSTSQLTGCRFTIQYADMSHKVATVQHLGGNVDGGSAGRDRLEDQTLGPVSNPALRRRYSIGQNKLPGAVRHKPTLQFRVVGDETRVYYGGDVASIFGYRDGGGAWHFWAHEIQTRGEVKALGRQDIA